jgi:hypothetical protein
MSDAVRSGTPQSTDKPFGPVAAVFLAAGIGSLVLGILTTLSEASDGIGSALEWSKSVGPLSGKTVISVLVFLVSWGVLQSVLGHKDPDTRKVFTWTAALVALGLVLTFPTFFQLFAPD